MKTREYRPGDYQKVLALYKDVGLYGGQHDKDRDSSKRLRKRIEADPESILVAEDKAEIVGTVSLIEDARVAWLFRFAVKENNHQIAKTLCDKAIAVLRERGHRQVLVYSPNGKEHLTVRYRSLGFNLGNTYACFWKDINGNSD